MEDLKQLALLFDDSGSEVEVKEVAAKTLKGKNKNKSQAAKAEKKQEKENELPPNEPRIVRYAGETIVLDAPDQLNWNLEQVRRHLEEVLGYPELTKDRTEMIYDKEKKLIIPVIKARKAGAVIESRIGRIDPEKGELEFSLPLIPGSYLQLVLDFFRAVYREKGTEAMAWILWDPKEMKYSLEIPLQHVTPGSVDVDEEYLLKHPEIQSEYLQVVHLHSHGAMDAFFSSVDDAWETGIRVYGVVGNLDRFVSTALFRVGCGGGKFMPIEYSKVFTKLDTNLSLSAPRAWLERVQKTV